MSDTIIRPERVADIAMIHVLHAAAFRSRTEARVVAALRASDQLAVSLVATFHDAVIGHVAFSPVTLDGAPGGLGLAPIAVRPEHRNKGVAARLVAEGIARCRESGAGFIVVLGEPRYYARFGFAPASARALRCDFGGGDAFQVLELVPGAIPGRGGHVEYAEAFAPLKKRFRAGPEKHQ